MEEAKHFIGNQWVTAASHETIPVIDPSYGQVFAQLGRGNAADIERAVQAARRAYEGPWGPGKRRRSQPRVVPSFDDHRCPSKRMRTRSASPAISSMPASPTNSTAKRCPINPASPSSPSANRMA